MKTISRVILSAIFLALTGLLVAMAKHAPALVFTVYPTLSRSLLAKIASFTGLLPFALWEALLALLLLWGIYTLIRSFACRRFLRWLSGVALTGSVLIFVFVALWGLGHFGPGVTADLGLTVRQYTESELVAAANAYTDQANALAARIPVGADGVSEFSGFSSLRPLAASGFSSLAARYPLFDGSVAPVKQLAAARLFSYFGTTGLFCPFTAESTVNPDTFPVSLPFTMCHEISHRMGVTAEDEANFCAFLACRANNSPEYQYSGYYSAFLYCYNALCEADPSAADTLWSRASARLQADCAAASAHYAPYEGEVQDAAQSVNDAYLKAFSEEAGVRSYGRVADLLIALYLSERA